MRFRIWQHELRRGPAGGRWRPSPLVDVGRDSARNLHATTASGGIADVGVVFEVNAAGQETAMHTFTGGPVAAALT